MKQNAALAASDIRGCNMRRHYHDNSSSGLGILDVLALVFIVLKLIGVIDWSWWWVLAPWWVPISIAFIAALLYQIGKRIK